MPCYGGMKPNGDAVRRPHEPAGFNGIDIPTAQGGTTMTPTCLAISTALIANRIPRKALPTSRVPRPPCFALRPGQKRQTNPSCSRISTDGPPPGPQPSCRSAICNLPGPRVCLFPAPRNAERTQLRLRRSGRDGRPDWHDPQTVWDDEYIFNQYFMVGAFANASRRAACRSCSAVCVAAARVNRRSTSR